MEISQNKIGRILYFLFASDVLNLSLFISVFGAHVLSLNGSHFFMGIIGSASGLISILWKPMAGSLGDSKGRKTILILCLTLSLIGNIITLLFSHLSLVFVGRLICAFGSPVQILLRTIATDVYETNEEKNAFFNKMGAIAGFCFMGGAMGASFISEAKHGSQYVFLLVCLNCLLNIGVGSLLPSSMKPLKKEDKKSTINKKITQELFIVYNNLRQINWTKYWDIFLIKASLDLTFVVMQTLFGIVILTDFGVSGRYLGYIFTLISMFSIITNVVMLKLNKTMYLNDTGYKKIIHGIWLLIMSFLGLGLTPVFGLFVAFLTSMSISRCLVEGALNEVLVSKADEADKGIMISSFDTVMSMAELVSPILAGILAEIFGAQLTLALCTVPPLIGLTIAYRQRGKID